VAAALTITPESGAITAKATICRIDVTGASSNRAPANTGGEYRQYIRCALAGTDGIVMQRSGPTCLIAHKDLDRSFHNGVGSF